MATKKDKSTNQDCGDTNVTMMRLANTLDRQQCEETTTIDRLSQFIDAVPRDAPVDAVFERFTKVRDNTIDVNDAVREVVQITRDERVDRLNDEVKLYHGVAEKWANMGPDITLREACHGVAHDTYALRFDPTIHRPTPEGPFNPSNVYGALYDINLENEIKERRVRAAKELFGNVITPKT